MSKSPFYRTGISRSPFNKEGEPTPDDYFKAVGGADAPDPLNDGVDAAVVGFDAAAAINNVADATVKSIKSNNEPHGTVDLFSTDTKETPDTEIGIEQATGEVSPEDKRIDGLTNPNYNIFRVLSGHGKFGETGSQKIDRIAETNPRRAERIRGRKNRKADRKEARQERRGYKAVITQDRQEKRTEKRKEKLDVRTQAASDKVTANTRKNMNKAKEAKEKALAAKNKNVK